ncbi:MAG: NAD(P)/FAD-dependent oxidoreductase, partial [Salinibacter sp.]
MSSLQYDAVVIGGGLAGCSTAHQLARRGHDVLLAEQTTYPRHKLCGEFLSPEAQASFRGLGVLEAVRQAGAHSIDQAVLSAPSGTMTRAPLPASALGLSRYELDQLLFRQAGRAGADGRSGTRVTDVRGHLDSGFRVTVGTDTVTTRLVFGAYGRRGRLDRTLDRSFLAEQTPYVGFKAHFAGPTASDLQNTIELHSAPGAYCGLSPVENDRINVCWIGHTDQLNAAGGTPEGWLHEGLRRNPVL